MARIQTAAPGRLLRRIANSQYGYVPGMVADADIEALRAAGWDDRGIWQATAIVSSFNVTGRLEAAAGLPPDEVPATARLKEATPDGRSASRLTRADR